jgi:hypothetical protein
MSVPVITSREQVKMYKQVDLAQREREREREREDKPTKWDNHLRKFNNIMNEGEAEVLKTNVTLSEY